MTRGSARGKAPESFHAIVSVVPEVTLVELIDVLHAGKITVPGSAKKLKGERLYKEG
jgi:hypothetical protein